MTFASFDFIFFYVAVLLAYYRLDLRGQNVLLLIASYFFYGVWDYRFLALLGGSTLVDYYLAQAIEDSGSPRRRRALITASVCISLCVLGYFKYANFFVDSFVALLGQADSHYALNIVLPVGISFYTFQSMSYTIDVYRGELKASRRLVDFALYIAYFPQLVAGPIERAVTLLPQLQAPRRVGNAQIASGLQLILIGFFKKLVIADAVVPMVERSFTMPWDKTSGDLIAAAYLFAFQIYADFGGYSDIARGSSRLLGIELMVNFKQPYFSANITEFWRRWHISLSTWLRDYVYVPLGGNRLGRSRTYLNLMLTMLLGGLWHGASMRFVVWGALHGLFLAIHKRIIGERKPEASAVSSGVGARIVFACKVIATFHLVCLTWIIFRATDSVSGVGFISRMLSVPGLPDASTLRMVLVSASFLLLIDFLQWRDDHELPVRAHWPSAIRGLVYATMLVLIAFVGESVAPQFIYFQF